MMVEPPREPWIRRVFELDDGVLVNVKQAVLENLGSLVSHSRESELRLRSKRALVKAAEVRGRGRAVETVIVIEHPHTHGVFVSVSENFLACLSRGAKSKCIRLTAPRSPRRRPLSAAPTNKPKQVPHHPICFHHNRHWQCPLRFREECVPVNIDEAVPGGFGIRSLDRHLASH